MSTPVAARPLDLGERRCRRGCRGPRPTRGARPRSRSRSKAAPSTKWYSTPSRSAARGGARGVGDREADPAELAQDAGEHGRLPRPGGRRDHDHASGSRSLNVLHLLAEPLDLRLERPPPRGPRPRPATLLPMVLASRISSWARKSRRLPAGAPSRRPAARAPTPRGCAAAAAPPPRRGARRPARPPGRAAPSSRPSSATSARARSSRALLPRLPRLRRSAPRSAPPPPRSRRAARASSAASRSPSAPPHRVEACEGLRRARPSSAARDRLGDARSPPPRRSSAPGKRTRSATETPPSRPYSLCMSAQRRARATRRAAARARTASVAGLREAAPAPTTSTRPRADRAPPRAP